MSELHSHRICDYRFFLKTVLLFAVVVGFKVTPVFPAAFENLGLGARSQGLGNAFVAVSDDYEAMYWNPAGLARLDQKTFHSEYRDLFGLGLLRYLTAGYSHPGIGHGTIAITLLRLDPVGDANFLDYSENTIVLSYGRSITESLFLGVNGKYYRVTGTVGASGMGMDFGLLYVIQKPWLTFGAAVQDFNRPLITWDTNARDRLPLRLRVGVSSQISKNTLLGTQVAWQDQESRSHHFGAEQSFFNSNFFLRLGGVERDNQWRMAWGMGLRYQFLSFDYGWERQKFLGDTQSFSLAFKF